MPEQIADLAAAHADVACGHVGVRADVPVELVHERLAEGHDFLVGLALWIEVRTTLAAAHRQGRQGVLEYLFKCQKLQCAKRD